MGLILGSTSPRRKEILGYFSIPFTTESSDFNEEEVIFDGDPQAFALNTAKGKAYHLEKKFPQDIILTADTVVYESGRVLMKPKDKNEAFRMLKELSGKSHSVFTAVCVSFQGELFHGWEETRVFFHELTDSQINQYISSLHTMDKAGGYAIQKSGSIVVKRIEGCYYNIMGLPIHTTADLLAKAGVDLWAHLDSV